MIGYLKGDILDIEGESLLLSVQGVGYELNCSQNTLDEIKSLQESVGIEMYVHTQMREDALTLFGFKHLNEKQLFLSLTKVNGIGPKSALRILSGAPLSQIIHMIEEGNTQALSALPKVGKKTAEQIILTLKGKLKASHPNHQGALNRETRQDIVSALVHLGFRLNEVEKAVSQLDTQLDVPSGIREGLRILSSHLS